MKTLQNITNFLLDMDGTLYMGKTPIDGSADFINRLTHHRKSFLLLTNNSSASSMEYIEKLSSMDIHVGTENIFTSSAATILYLQRLNKAGKIFLLATPSVEKEFKQAGLELSDNNPECVVLTFDKSITYKKMERACQLILSGVPFIATHPDVVCPTENLPIPDCGAITQMITAATGISPKVIGKPNPEIIKLALKKTKRLPRKNGHCR